MKKPLSYQHPNFLMLPNSYQTSIMPIPTNPDPFLPLSSIYSELHNLDSNYFIIRVWLQITLNCP